MNKIHVATLEDLKAIQAGLKLYKDIRQDALVRQINAKEVFLDNDTIAVIHQMKRAGRMGEYKYGAGEWHVAPILSINRKNPMGPIIFLRRFIEEYVRPGKLIGCIHNVNKTSMQFHTTFGFKPVGKISWSKGTIPGKVVVYDCSVDPMEKFLK